MQTKADTLLIHQHRKALVVGLGATGFSVVRYLCARGLEVAVADTREQPPLLEQLHQAYPQVTTHLGSLDIAASGDHSLLVASPGLALAEPALRAARERGAMLVGDIELFLQENSQPVIAITGSNGKSTVTTLVGNMCRDNGLRTLVAGNIGLPVLDALTDQQDFEIAVLELSSFQLETTSAVPAKAAAILNISADHQDRYPSMGDYVLAKARIFRGAEQAIVPRHDEDLQQISNTSEMLTFGLDEPENAQQFGLRRSSKARWLCKGEQRLMRLRDIPLLGLHNVLNVLAAFALVEFLRLPLQGLVDSVKSFSGLEHRMQTVCVADGVTWVNDSKATNIGATSTALASIEQDIWWLAGGQGKGADFTQLRDAVNPRIRKLFLFGEDADQMEEALAGMLPVTRVENIAQAVAAAGQEAQAGSVVLLSPACASFDQYRNYEQRGQDFSRLAQAWAQRGVA